MNFQKEFEVLKRKLDDAIKENLKDIEDSQQELKLIVDIMKKYPDKLEPGGFIDSVIQDALDDAKANVADGEKLIKAYHLLNKGKHGR